MPLKLLGIEAGASEFPESKERWTLASAGRRIAIMKITLLLLISIMSGVAHSQTDGVCRALTATAVISETGCGRATGSAEANKMLTWGGKTHVAWLDSEKEGFFVRIRTLDHESRTWSAVTTIGTAADNHGGPALNRRQPRLPARRVLPASPSDEVPALPQVQRCLRVDRDRAEDIRKHPDLPWREVSVPQRGIEHVLQVREIGNVLWQGGARRRPLRLIVIEKAEFRLSTKRSSTREPAYLLTTDLEAPLHVLLQAYVDRWEIEVNHRDEKQQIGVGDAQVWSKDSVSRNAAFAVASYSLLILASIEAFGPSRTQAYPELPPWRSMKRKMPIRPSCRDMLMQLRREVLSSSEQMKVLGLEVTIESLNRAAA